MWTSHLTSFYFERGAALHRHAVAPARDARAPKPPHDARLFFATLPPCTRDFRWATARWSAQLYREPDLAVALLLAVLRVDRRRTARAASSTGTARRSRRCTANTPDPFFQVGSDLLLLDRPGGAAHAFRRGLAAGEDRSDHLYWLGWAELWRGNRADAEQAWQMLGASDDSLRWLAHVRAAYEALQRAATRSRRAGA